MPCLLISRETLCLLAVSLLSWELYLSSGLSTARWFTLLYRLWAKFILCEFLLLNLDFNVTNSNLLSTLMFKLGLCLLF